MCKNKIKELKRYNRFKRFYKNICSDSHLWEICCKNKTNEILIIKSILTTFYNLNKTITINKTKKNLEILLEQIVNNNFIIQICPSYYMNEHFVVFNFNKNPCKNLNSFDSYYSVVEICEIINIEFDKIFKNTFLGTFEIMEDNNNQFEKDISNFYKLYKIELIDKSKKNRSMLKNLLKISELKNV